MILSHYDKKLKLFSGNANPKLASDIAACLGEELGKARVGRFKDGEISVRVDETVRGKESSLFNLLMLLLTPT